MTHNAPHINIDRQRILLSVLDTPNTEFETWPERVRELAIELATEFFILHANPFVHPEVVKNSVFSRLEAEREGIPLELYQRLTDKMEHFWYDFRKLSELKETIQDRLADILPEDGLLDSPHALVQFSTDATGLMLELPLLVVSPETTEQVRDIVSLAREIGFFIVPRGGGSGLTGGAIPALRKSVILSLSRFKHVLEVDADRRVLRAQSGVITQEAIDAAAEKDLLLTIDPASKTASSLGGNISENAGGPYAFEYGTTLDTILEYTMVRPSGEVIHVQRKDHPGHKIYPEETVTFEVFDDQGVLLETIRLRGEEIRAPGLGKDVTNKFLGGLPGVQKEGVDGIITEASFLLQPRLKHSRTLCLEFFGPSMRNASLVIKDLVRLRNSIREGSNAVTMSSLEEFGSKYVQAIDYQKKSQRYEGDPISVLLIQLDSDSRRLLEDTLWTIVGMADLYDDVDVFVAEDPDEAARFWEDRHRLSAISRRTSGFKINEDVVLPLDKIPEFSDFLEEVNRHCLAEAYGEALNEVDELLGSQSPDDFVGMEKAVCRAVLQGDSGYTELSEQSFGLQIHYFFRDLQNRYPHLKDELRAVEEELFFYRIEVANHMHAGDGNCHVNIPVHSNSPAMLARAEAAVDRIFKKVLELKGEVSGEHGIGITKIRYLSQDKIAALKGYKERIDPDNILNPHKLQQNHVLVAPFTLSWERLIEDIAQSELPKKDRLIRQLKHIQICTRCGKCKQVCPMYYPEKGFLHHPRNKNISLGAMLSALTYTQNTANLTDPYVLSKLQEITEYCTACGKCMSICPVKIDSADVTLSFRSYLDQEGAGGHPLKSKMLHYFGAEPERIPKAVKAMALGQSLHNTAVRFIPPFWRRRLNNPLFTEPNPAINGKNLDDILHLKKGNAFLPPGVAPGEPVQGVFYFPGCGAGLFFPDIALAGLKLLLQAGLAVVIPNEHKCCGYPLLAAGCAETFAKNAEANAGYLAGVLRSAAEENISLDALITSCGTCRAALERYELPQGAGGNLRIQDVLQAALPQLDNPLDASSRHQRLIYHCSCHNPLTGVRMNQADRAYARFLEQASGATVDISPHCCAESGLGALTSPGVYNNLRKRKKDALEETLHREGYSGPILVSCPSCKIGINRILKSGKRPNQVLHTLEYLAANDKDKPARLFRAKDSVRLRLAAEPSRVRG